MSDDAVYCTGSGQMEDRCEYVYCTVDCNNFVFVILSRKVSVVCRSARHVLLRDGKIIRFAAHTYSTVAYVNVNVIVNRGFIYRINAKPLMLWYASKRRKEESSDNV